MGNVPEATRTTTASTIVALLLILLLMSDGGTIAGGNGEEIANLSSLSASASTALSTNVVLPHRFDCRLSGMECFHDGICSRDGSHCDCSPSPNWFGAQCELRRCSHRHNPCINGAECEKTKESFKCHCAVGFTGTYCENAVPTICDRDGGRDDPCVHGTCRVGTTVDDFVCDCQYGYTGKICADINFCQSSTEVCLNGFCMNDQNGSHCQCQTGWSGQRCQEDIDECQLRDKLCQNGGKCVNTIGGFYCECPSDFVGYLCEVPHRPTDPCLANHFPCLNGAQCHENIMATTAVWALDAHFDWRWECECLPGFEGKHCERAVDECDMGMMTCLNGGKCAHAWADDVRDGNGIVVERNWHASQCKCMHGFEGDFCEQDINECERFGATLCKNGGTCVNRHGSYMCICVGGFAGKFCEINIDDCVDNLCYAGSTCVDGIARYDCRCAPDRIGALCEFQNICNIHENLCEHGHCFTNPFNGSYTCLCDEGWKGQNCTEDVDECSDEMTRCFNGKCVNLVGSYKCECEFGYTGDMCASRISYCDDEQQCQNGGICHDQLGHYECRCKFGFSGKNCEFQHEESANKCELDCQNGATCQNASSEQCECPPKFGGILCEIEKPDPCEFKPCPEGTICTPTKDYNSLTCECAPGQKCAHLSSPCERGHNPCVHGQCRIESLSDKQKVYCECQHGWKGTFCEQSAENGEKAFNQSCPLHKNPCKNGGQCVSVKDNQQNGAIHFECICPKNFSGTLCENMPIERHCENGCRNGGKCGKTKDGSWGCKCLIGFEGEQCEIERNPCSKSPSPCKHKGKCVNIGNDRYRCDCAPGWIGPNCEENRNDCEKIVCANGGKCHDKVNHFQCECSRGFTGRHCETSVPVDKFNRTDLMDKENCKKAGCEAKYGNHRCDSECNLFACQFDGGDCSTKQAQPFGKCPQASYCSHVFADGKCDEICNNERCLFDGFDCLERHQATCPWMVDCAKVYADGHCDEQCNQANCGWDGGDCVHDAHEPDPTADDQPKLLLGELFLAVALHPSTLFNDTALFRQFLVALSAHLRASLALAIDLYDKKPKLFEWRSDKGIGKRIELPPEVNATALFNVRYDEKEGEAGKRSKRKTEEKDVVEGIALFLQVDVTMCNMIAPGSLAQSTRLVGVHTLCFSDLDNVAAYLGAANAKQNLDIPIAILQSEALKPRASSLFFWFALLAFAMVSIASAAAGTVFASGRIRSRQRRYAKTWKPEFPAQESKIAKNSLATLCGGVGPGHYQPPLIDGNTQQHLFNAYTQHNHHQQNAYQFHQPQQQQQQHLMFNAGSISTDSCASSTAASAIPLIRNAESLNSLTSNVHANNAINNNQQQQEHGQFSQLIDLRQQQQHFAPGQYHSLVSHNKQQTIHSNAVHPHHAPPPGAAAGPYCSRSSSSGIGGSSTEHSPIDSHGRMIEDMERRKLLAHLRENALFSPIGLLGLEERLEPQLVNAPDERGRTLLHLLFQNPNFKADDEQCLVNNIQLLFTKGAKINALDTEFTSPLLLAVRGQRLLAVRKLVTEFEADQRLADADGRTPLYAVCESGHVEMAEFLIGEAVAAASCSRNSNKNDGNGETEADEPDPLVAVLSALYKRNETPLMRCALMSGKHYLRIAELMIETLEADKRAFFVNQTGDAEFLGYSGKTALHFAASCNNVSMIELLVRHGANREATDQQGRTPLFLAVELGQYDSTEALLQLHADRTKANSADTKIIPELISRPGHGEFMKLFKKYPEQQHFQQMGRPCSSGTANVQQRHNGCEVKIGTKRQRSTCAKRSNGTDEQSDFIGAEVAKKAALSRPYEQFELQKPSQIVGTNVASTSATSSVVIISPLPPQNMLTPPNSDQSVYSTSSPSPNKTSRTSSNSISCNASQQLVVRPLAVNVGNRYAQQPQNHQQQCQEFCTFEAKKGNVKNECGLGELETDGRRKGESKWAEDKLCIKVKCEEKGNDTKFAFCLQQCENFCQSSTEVCLNGFCMNDQNGSQCQTGWTRQRCQEDIDECQLRDKLCQNGGKCVNTIGGFYCECPSDFVGYLCEVPHRPTDPCLANHFPCLNGAQCHENIMATTAVWALDAHFDWRWECECLPGFEGKHCERAVDECDMGMMTCLNGGKCAHAWADDVRDGNGIVVERNWHASQCKCMHGFEGDFCEQDINECERFGATLCKNGGTCVNRHGSYMCICVGGFAGKFCDINIDDCVDNLCYAGSTCVDGIARYDCRCAPDRIGALCEFQNICNIHENLCEHGHCFTNPFNGSYTCLCDEGWKGQNCTEDVDECSDEMTRCFNGKCVNLVGSYKCECEFGYTGDMCASRISYCDDEQPCQNGGICHDQLGHYECRCKFGFSGKNCEFQHEESANKCELDCQNGATCQNASSEQCECPPKFGGILCEIEKPDPCEFKPCPEGTICTPTKDYNSLTCECAPGQKCAHLSSPCERGHNPCVHGQCRIESLSDKQKVYCECQHGWKGTFCEQSAENGEKAFNQSCPLHKNPCKNGGQCVSVKDNQQNGAIHFECICPKNFSGTLCENMPIARHCENGCRNGGKCGKTKDGSWGCKCLTGFEGEQCEIERNPCSKSPSPCKHKGKCVNIGNDRYRCDCAPGWIGPNCEENRNDCEKIVCANGGKCHDKVNHFQCECSRGFTGRHCETSVPVDKFNRTDLMDKENCKKAGCEAKYGNHRCDSECNLFACQFDGGDCSTKQAQPFGKCPQASYCSHVFADGKCDEICNNERCLFDGFDCLERHQATCPWMVDCAKVYADGHCDEQCNQANCGWDGGDCVHDAHEPDPTADDQPKLLLGELFLAVALHPSTLFNDTALFRQFLVALSAHLRASLALAIDLYDKKPKLFEWRSDKGIGKRIELPPEVNATALFNVRYDEKEGEAGKRSKRKTEEKDVVEGIALFLQVDVTMCNMIAPGSLAQSTRLVGVHTLCFSDLDNVAAYLGAANAKQNLDIPIAILQSEALKPRASSLFFWFALLAFAMVSIASAAAGTVFASGRIRSRQRRYAKTWKPEFPAQESKIAKNSLATLCGGVGPGHYQPPLIDGNTQQHLFNAYTQHNHHQQNAYQFHQPQQQQQQHLMFNAGSISTDSCASSTAASAIPLIRNAESLNSLTSNVHANNAINNNQQQQEHGQFSQLIDLRQQQQHFAPGQYHSLVSHNKQQTIHSNAVHPHHAPPPGAAAGPYCSRSSSSGIGGSSTEHSPIDSHGRMIEDMERRKLLAHLRENALFSPIGLLGLEERLEPQLVNAPDERGRTLLHLLFQNPNFKADDEQCLVNNIQLLFTKGAKINALDTEFTSPLLLAVRGQRLLAVRKLVTEFEADQRLADADGRTPLYAVCESGHVEMAEFLIGEAVAAASCSRNSNKNDGNGETEADEPDPLVAVLSALYKRNETPLMRCALMSGRHYLRIAELMIETLEADQRAFFVNQTGDAEFLGYSGKTALHFAASCNNVAMIELLVRHGANREATDQQGRTPLFLAVELGQYDSTEALLQLHADRTKANSADTKIIPELISRPGHGEFMKLFKKYPEQQHFQQMGRPCSSGTANVQQRHNGCEVKIGTKRQRSTCAKRSNGTDEQSDFIGAEVAKKAALSRPYEQFELQKPSQIVGTNVASTSATSSVVVISPPPPQNMLTPPNSDQSVYSTSSPSPNNTSRTSSNSTSCNGSQLVVRPLAVNVGNRYAQQPQNHQQQCQEMLRHSVDVQQQQHIHLEHIQHVQKVQNHSMNWCWPSVDGLPMTLMAPAQKQQHQQQQNVHHVQINPQMPYAASMTHQQNLMPPFGCAGTAFPNEHVNAFHSSNFMGCYSRQMQYKQNQQQNTRELLPQDLLNLPSPVPQCQSQQAQNGDNLRHASTTEFSGLANFACGGDPLSTSLDNLEDLVPDQHLTMEEPSVGRWL